MIALKIIHGNEKKSHFFALFNIKCRAHYNIYIERGKMFLSPQWKASSCIPSVINAGEFDFPLTDTDPNNKN